MSMTRRPITSEIIVDEKKRSILSHDLFNALKSKNLLSEILLEGFAQNIRDVQKHHYMNLKIGGHTNQKEWQKIVENILERPSTQ